MSVSSSESFRSSQEPSGREPSDKHGRHEGVQVVGASNQIRYRFSFTTPSCCSVGQGALVGTSVAASLACTSLLSVK